MGSALPRNISTSAHDWGQVLMFEGQSGSFFGSFTTTTSESFSVVSSSSFLLFSPPLAKDTLPEAV